MNNNIKCDIKKDLVKNDNQNNKVILNKNISDLINNNLEKINKKNEINYKWNNNISMDENISKITLSLFNKIMKETEDAQIIICDMVKYVHNCLIELYRDLLSLSIDKDNNIDKIWEFLNYDKISEKIENNLLYKDDLNKYTSVLHTNIFNLKLRFLDTIIFKAELNRNNKD